MVEVCLRARPQGPHRKSGDRHTGLTATRAALTLKGTALLIGCVGEGHRVVGLARLGMAGFSLIWLVAMANRSHGRTAVLQQ